MVKCFLSMTDEELEEKSKKCRNHNTMKAEEHADKAFRTFLVWNGCDENNTDYWNFDEPTLDKYLSKFWFYTRKNTTNPDSQEEDPEIKEQLYKANSLKNFHYSLNRILKTKGHLYDITNKKTASFHKSQQAFADAIKELKANRKGDVESYPEIEESGKCNFFSEYTTAFFLHM